MRAPRFINCYPLLLIVTEVNVLKSVKVILPLCLEINIVFMYFMCNNV